MIRKVLYVVLLALLLWDTRASFKMYYSQVLDGDIACNLVPANDVQPILDNPLGIQTIINNETYANPNRFFCHWFFKGYLTATPKFLQEYVSPIESVYLSTAIAKTGIQIVLILLLAAAISESVNVLKLTFIGAAVLVAPFFHTNGYRDFIGIVDCSITYSFFYALPCIFMLLYFLPVLQRFYYGKVSKYQFIVNLLWIPLAFVVCLSGPLNPGIVLVFSLLVGFYYIKEGVLHSQQNGFVKKVFDGVVSIPQYYWFYLVPVCVLSVYSLFLGQYNSLTIESRIPLSEMYSRLPYGILNLFNNKVAFPVLLGMLAINSLLIFYKYNSPEGKKILNIFKWIGLFSVFYILLLPLGGYREYRHYIIRYDTIMPITLALLFVYGISTIYLIQNIKAAPKWVYLFTVIAVAYIYNNGDKSWGAVNACERSALEELAVSKDSIVFLKQDCSVVGWGKIVTPEASELNSGLLVIWGITKEKKRYYQK